MRRGADPFGRDGFDEFVRATGTRLLRTAVGCSCAATRTWPRP